MDDIARIMENPNCSTDSLVANARGLIQNCDYALPAWLSVLDGSLLSVLSAMLDCAPSDCGLRYVSSAICACKSDRALGQLGLVWFAHFLWPFKALNWYEDREARRKESSPPCDVLREQVLLRQDYQCAISGIGEMGHKKVPMCHLRIGRILHRPIVGSEKVMLIYDYPHELEVLTSEGQTDFFGMMTREIVKNYIDPTVNLDALADGPHNAIASQHDIGMFFNNFLFSLKPTTNPDEYTAETYGERIWLVPIKSRIVFEGDTPPDPGYLHLHACMADVLQRSGAGKVIDKILKCIPERTCPADIIDLQQVLDTLGLRYSLVAAFELPVCRDVLF
ncbi:uncharacterized protein ARMOST_21269 [Armillaria ostoyae]|uniref:HNH nuclease domain-containing protein n=1 Tax=Armillaria ostoyae TaxID=47428 RepID=A0A284S9N9_ARMOS|nr:uncharacterized protein ARMOST_21269 [Armillaria ostoyae]